MNLQFSSKIITTSVIFALIAAIFYFDIFLPRDISFVFDPPLLLPILNGIFVSIASFAVAYFSMKSYLADGMISLLFLGSGSISLGVTNLATGWLMHIPGGQNLNVTLFNCGAMIAGLLHFVGAVITTVKESKKSRPGTRKILLVLAYSAAAWVILLLGFLSFKGVLPRFYLPYIGPTLIRQFVLGTALILFALSSVIFLRIYYHSRSNFFYWYSSALTLFAGGLMGVFMMRTLDDPINWIGRMSQYLGGVYLLVAVMIAVRMARTRDISLDTAFTELFRNPWELYESLVQTSTDALVSIDSDRKVLLWNPSAKIMFGYTRKEAVGSSLAELVFSPDQDQVLGNLLSDYAKGADSHLSQSERFELELKRYNGDRFPAELAVSVRRISNQSINTLVVKDLTERKQAEKMLRDSEERYRTLFEYAKDAILVTDPSGQGGVLAANPEACRLFGYTQDEMLSLDRAAMLDSSDPLVRIWMEQREKMGHATSVLRYLRKDGTSFYGDTTTAFFEARGEKLAVAIIRDITDRKRMEEEVRKSRDELQIRVKERTAELELRNKELQDFAFVASHDLQEPLRKVKTFGEMLASRCGLSLDEVSGDYLKRMHSATARMQDLLNSLLAYSRVTASAAIMKGVISGNQLKTPCRTWSS
jgi:PAS domain S-box-containing protein